MKEKLTPKEREKFRLLREWDSIVEPIREATKKGVLKKNIPIVAVTAEEEKIRRLA